MGDVRGITHEDYADEAESASRGNAWPKAAALYRHIPGRTKGERRVGVRATGALVYGPTPTDPMGLLIGRRAPTNSGAGQAIFQRLHG